MDGTFSIFNILSLLGGLALFLFGMDFMGDGLKKLAGGKLESILARLTSNRFKGFLLGFIVTAVIQSSSATTVMLVGFVNSGIMTLGQTISVIMGANIGTTVTAWLLSLTGIGDSASNILKLLKPESFTPILAVIGVVMTMMSNSDSKKNIGSILLGFAILMFGMESMSDAVSVLRDNEAFKNILTMFSNPIMGILVGTIFTAIIQSSSASIGILQALALSCMIPHSTALPVLLGMNIGTTITPIISAISGNTESRRVAFSCLYIKMIGVVIVTSIFYLIFYTTNILDAFMASPASVFSIALYHTLFNILSTIILIPFCTPLEKLAIKTIKGKKGDEEVDIFGTLDDRFLAIPSFATEKCRELVCDMAKVAQKGYLLSVQLLTQFDEKKYKDVVKYEKLVDKYEDKTSAYLVKLAASDISAKDGKLVTELLHCIGDIERISDHTVNIADAAKEMYEKDIVFSKKAQKDIGIITAAATEVLGLAVSSMLTGNIDIAKEVEPLEQVIDRLKRKIKSGHISRLQKGECTMELGFILSDLLTNYERISDHCSNIAVNLIEIANDDFEAHQYFKTIKNHNDEAFDAKYEEYKQKYTLE